jgi:hypothetical protein
MRVGEPSSATVSAAMASAAFNAIGVRLRSVPFSPEKTLAASEPSECNLPRRKADCRRA